MIKMAWCHYMKERQIIVPVSSIRNVSSCCVGVHNAALVMFRMDKFQTIKILSMVSTHIFFCSHWSMGTVERWNHKQGQTFFEWSTTKMSAMWYNCGMCAANQLPIISLPCGPLWCAEKEYKMKIGTHWTHYGYDEAISIAARLMLEEPNKAVAKSVANQLIALFENRISCVPHFIIFCACLHCSVLFFCFFIYIFPHNDPPQEVPFIKDVFVFYYM